MPLFRPLSRYALLPLFCIALLLLAWLMASLPSSLVLEQGGSVSQGEAVLGILFAFILPSLLQLLLMRFAQYLTKFHLYHFVPVKVPRSFAAKAALFLLGGVLPAVGIAFLGVRMGRIWKQASGPYGISFDVGDQSIFYLTTMLIMAVVGNTLLYLKSFPSLPEKKQIDNTNFLRYLFHLYERVHGIKSTAQQSLPLPGTCSGGMILCVFIIYNSTAQPVQITCGVFVWCILAALLMRKWGRGLPKMHPWYPMRSYTFLGILFLTLCYLQISFSLGEPPLYERVHFVASALGWSLSLITWVPLFSYSRYADKNKKRK